LKNPSFTAKKFKKENKSPSAKAEGLGISRLPRLFHR